MSWRDLPAILCILSLTLPVAVIFYNRFYSHRSLAALLVYYTSSILYNLMAEGFLPSTTSFLTGFGMLNNFLDVPLMLTVLLFFCPSKQKQTIVKALIISFIAYEVVVLAIHGFNRVAIVYILGPGLILVLLYTGYLFVKQVKFSIMHGKNQGRMFMLASILFAYACYTLIYYFFYIQKTPYKADTLLLYYISSFAAAVLMAVGLHLMRKRMKELESLKLTRKELAVFFS
ncbi:MAG TPA: hypothetical protein VFR58_16970 [Flavisolibacter sp.]|nr:hypothetical protein [Flavisolibacter sp.]